jgi:Domain of unknown function (DUF4062)
LGHDAIAMEDYVATDRRPLQKCLADVAACDGYIGIFAWRYGFVPEADNSERRSTALSPRRVCTVAPHKDGSGQGDGSATITRCPSSRMRNT